MAPFRWIGVIGAIYLVFIARHVSAAPTPESSAPISLIRPLSYQFPPPARVGQDFSWTISSGTFGPAGGISYTATNLPPWLSFTNSTLAFTGRPTSGDVGTYNIGLTGSLDDQTASDIITLDVTSRQGPVTINDPLAKQLAENNKTITSCYPYPPTSINYPGARVPPGWSFSLGFEPQTFVAPTRVFYRASLADGSALPPWLSFNNQTVTFDGVAPYVGNTTEMFNIVVVGSDTFGYTDIKESFNLTVAAHDLELVSLAGFGTNITAGSWNSVPLGPALQAGLQLDGGPIKDGDIINVSLASSVEWLTYSAGNTSLSGSPPLSQAPVSVPIYIVDKYGDTINTTLVVSVVPSAFTSSSLGPVLINSTDAFNIDLAQSYFQSSHPTEITATYDPSAASQWIIIKDHSLTGTIPPNLTYSSVDVDLKVKDLITNAVSSATLTLSLAPQAIQSASADTPHGLPTTVKIVLGTVGALIAATIALMMACIVRRRRRERAQEATMQDEGRYSPTDQETVIGHDWHDPQTPAMISTEKLGEPLSAQQLMSRHATQSPCGTEAELVSIPYIPSMSKTDQDTWATRTVRYLTNPFGRTKTRILPIISHPVVMPSFSNAAYQAQLAAAVDSAGIVKRGGAYTYPDTPNLDAPSGSGSRDTGDTTRVSEGPEDERDTTDSHFHGHSSRASWESEPPFAWATSDTPGRKQAATESSELRGESTNATFATRSVETHETHQATLSDDVPVQRSDFRPVPFSREDTVPHIEDISIDGIHFPTDSDIAQTESSSDQEAIITTASRIDARQTLESPQSSTPGSQSSYTSRIPVRGPRPTGGAIITTQSRLVSLGKERIVSIKDSPRRDASQTAVVVSSRSGASQDDGQSRASTFDTGRSTPPSLPAFPSLPAIPLPIDTSPLHRILLGVAEPFHFYPPLSIHSSPSSLTTTTSSSHDSKPQGLPGATYEAMLEVKEGMKALPMWIHFEDMELWGVPEEEHRGLWTVRVVEVSQEQAKRTVGRFSIEVVGR